MGPEKNIFVQKKYEPIKNFAVIRPCKTVYLEALLILEGMVLTFKMKKKLWNPSKKLSNVLLATLFFFFKSPKPHTLKRKKKASGSMNLRATPW